MQSPHRRQSIKRRFTLSLSLARRSSVFCSLRSPPSRAEQTGRSLICVLAAVWAAPTCAAGSGEPAQAPPGGCSLARWQAAQREREAPSRQGGQSRSSAMRARGEKTHAAINQQHPKLFTFGTSLVFVVVVVVIFDTRRRRTGAIDGLRAAWATLSAGRSRRLTGFDASRSESVRFDYWPAAARSALG